MSENNGFRYKKEFGQNFITDTNLLRAIVKDAGVTEKDAVIEVGAGAGSLTAELTKAAKKVLSFEIDYRLESVLKQEFSGCGNITFVFGDVLKEDFNTVRQFADGGGYKLVANLPYYITTPVLFYFIDNEPPESITVMVQKEVADRLTAKPGTKDYGALTVSLGSLYDIKITRQVSRKMFRPEPNVDSAVVNMTLNNAPPGDKPVLARLIKSAFGNRRKTLVNNLSQSFNIDKAGLEKILAGMGLPPAIRGEALSIGQFNELSGILCAYGSK